MKLHTKDQFSFKSGLIFSYIIAYLPIIAIIGGLICKLLLNSVYPLGLIGYWSKLLVFLFPFLFLALDLYPLILNRKSLPSIKNNIKTYPELYILLLFLVWCIVSVLLQVVCFGSSLATTSVVGELFVQEGLLIWIYYAIIVFGAFLVNDVAHTKKILFHSVIIAASLCILTIIDNTGNIFFFHSYHNTFWAGMMINSNHLGYYLAIFASISATLLCVSKKTYLKVLSLSLVLLFCFCMMLNDTFGCLLSVFICFICLPFIFKLTQRKFKLIYLVPLIAFSAIALICAPIANALNSTYKSSTFFGQLVNLFKQFFVVTKNPTSNAALSAGTDRWGLWLQAVNEILSSPLIGTGNVLLRPHNEYLQIAQVFGLPALIIYLTALIVILVKAIKNKNKLSSVTLVLLMGALAYLISALFGCTMPHTMPFFALMLGLAIKSLNTDAKGVNKPI